jgi:hypothetical protein
MKVQFSLCAQTASVDRASNRLSIFSVVDHIPALSLPFVLPALTFVSILQSEQEEPVTANFTGVFEIRNNETLIAKADVPISFIYGRLARVILNVTGLHIAAVGHLHFTLALPDYVVAELQVPVVALNPANPFPTTHS